MAKYKAIVSFEFDDDDIADFAEMIGVPSESIDPSEMIYGELDNLSLGNAWLEQLYKDGEPQIVHLS